MFNKCLKEEKGPLLILILSDLQRNASLIQLLPKILKCDIIILVLPIISWNLWGLSIGLNKICIGHLSAAVGPHFQYRHLLAWQTAEKL